MRSIVPDRKHGLFERACVERKCWVCSTVDNDIVLALACTNLVKNLRIHHRRKSLFLSSYRMGISLEKIVVIIIRYGFIERGNESNVMTGERAFHSIQIY